MDEKSDTKAFQLRLPRELVDEVDVRAKEWGYSRNEWYEKMTAWVLEHVHRPR